MDGGDQAYGFKTRQTKALTTEGEKATIPNSRFKPQDAVKEEYLKNSIEVQDPTCS